MRSTIGRSNHPWRRKPDRGQRRGQEDPRPSTNICPQPGQRTAVRPRGQRQAHPRASSTPGRSTPRGTAIDISRGNEGYQDPAYARRTSACREVKCELGFRPGSCGSTSTTPSCSLKEYIGRSDGDGLGAEHGAAHGGLPLPQGRSSTPTTSCGTTPTASSITTTCTTSIASRG